MPNTYYPFQPLQQQSPREFYFYNAPITPPPEPQETDDYFTCKPPDYDAGSYIRVLSRQMMPPPNTKSALSIVIDQDDKATFNRGDCITGRLYIRPTQDIPFEKLLVDLQVAETIVRGEICEKASFTKATSIARHRLQEEAYPSDRVFHKGLEYSFTFSFVIPHTICEDPATGPSQLPLHYQLPPSVGTHSETGDHSADVNDRSLVISYRIRARITKPGVQFATSRNPKELYQAQQYKYLRVMPSYPAIRLAPTLYEGTRNMKQRILKRPTKHKLHFALAQVPVFHLAEGTAPMVSLQLAFEIDASTTMQPQMPSPQVKNVSYKLAALTTSTTSPRHYYPHHDDPQVHTAKDTFPSQTAAWTRPEWRLEYNSKKTNRSMYVCTLQAPLALPSDKRKVVPNYFTELSSRQYEVTMSVELNGYAPASFTFPAVIARARNIASMFWPSEEDAATDPVPTYSYYEETDQPCPYDVKLEFGRDYSRRVNVDSSPLPSPQPVRPQELSQVSWKITA
ncbi:hypothetical protein TRVA0_007S00254 [Trichomonascus vanleenenianus]|uniref:uncharacterized protein n=1 Tax=Trichomonascus vanleenenianus TaxID=2268995 RepID=UPI003EC96426